MSLTAGRRALGAASPCVVAIVVSLPLHAAAQTLQVGADAQARGAARLAIDHVAYRAARCELEQVREPENDSPNRGGFVAVYLRNVSDAPVRLRFWRLNGRDESVHRVDRRDAWDRTHDPVLAPGATTVTEIDGLSTDFAAGRPFAFSWVDDSWQEVGGVETVLTEDPVRVAFIRVLPGARGVEAFVRVSGTGPVEFSGAEVVGRPSTAVTWSTRRLAGPGIAIARIDLAEPLETAGLVIIKVALADATGPRSVFGHRRAFVDRFPVGTWGAEEALREELHGLSIDTAVVDGRRSDSFFARDAERLGMRAMVHTGIITDVDRVRELSGSPHVACWMIQDEPDWSIPAATVLLAERTVRSIDTSHPTMVTLCRNVKFFEYAPIPDIACMDHYCVTAPSSSAWPQPWGTRLEETAHYTSDLKMAAEPRPVWVWTQGLFDWTERPERPVPTVAELSAQLVLNLSRGAKGILWFSYKSDLGVRYPDVRAAMAGWGRTLLLTRDDLLAAEPSPVPVEAPPGVDARLLVGRDAAVLCLTNLDYEPDPAGYRFRERQDVRVTFEMPAWLRPERAVRLDHESASEVAVTTTAGRASLGVGALVDAAIVLLPADPARPAAVLAAWTAAMHRDPSRAAAGRSSSLPETP